MRLKVCQPVYHHIKRFDFRIMKCYSEMRCIFLIYGRFILV